jgi:hypothetical protein
MNSKLKDRVYNLPQNIIEKINITINSLNGEYVDGIDRAKKLLNDKTVNYGQLKRIIHDMKNMDKETESLRYNLCGGDLMEKWSNQFLTGERNQVKNNKEMTRISTEIGGVDRKNPYLKSHEKKKFKMFDASSINKKNSDKTSVSPIISSVGIFEEIERIKSLIKH